MLEPKTVVVELLQKDNSNVTDREIVICCDLWVIQKGRKRRILIKTRIRKDERRQERKKSEKRKGEAKGEKI